jgi:hypothetical protein
LKKMITERRTLMSKNMDRDQDAPIQYEQNMYTRASSPPNGSGNWVRCKLTAELVEDTHPGSGSGGVGIDALVARDREGRPVIWASYLEGTLRNAARRLHGQEAAEAFFGRAGGERQRFVLTSLYTMQTAICRVWRSAARAAFDNRAPREDTLRAIEFVPKGTRFEGLVELPADSIPFLRRLVAEVDAIGYGRAAGAGKVKLTLSEAQLTPQPVGEATSRLLLLLRSVDPISITKTATPTNLLPSFAFVPGRSLLGAMADWLLGENRRSAATLLVSGLVSVSDALPLPDDPTKLGAVKLEAVEVIPAPLSLQSEKPRGTPGNTPWWALPDSPLPRVDQGPIRGGNGEVPRLKRPEPDLFVCRFGSGSAWTAYRPCLRVRLRNGRPNPTQPDPSLFAVEQIAERTLFLAELRGDAAQMAVLGDALRPVLEGYRWLQVGRGGAPLEVVRGEWVAPGRPAEVNAPAYLTLTSDLLVRDELLRWLTVLDAPRMAVIPGWPEGVEAKPVVQESAPMHGFNGTARLWRQPAAAVRRGSVFTVDGVADLVRAAADGRWLGERTHEGFGRFRLDNVLPGVTDGVSTDASEQRQPSPTPDEADDAVAITTRRWFDEHKRLAKTATPSASCPSLSQWFDLVFELERELPDALPSRKDHSTAGKRAWRDGDARAILDEIQKLPNGQRGAHARMFVRWLRAEMRKRES